MSSRVKVVSVLIVSACIGLFLYCFHSREPSFKGRSLTSWIDDLRPNRGNRPAAEAAICSIGSDGLPAIRGMLRCRDTWARKRFVAWIGPQRAAKLNLQPDYFYNWNGIAAARVLGPTAVPVAADVVPYLTNSDWSLRINAAHALSSIGPSASKVVPQMLAALSDSNSRVRPEILDAIALIGGDPRAINPKLLPLLSDPDEQTRARAVACVLTLGTNADEIASVGNDALRDKSSYVRSSALVELTKHGTNAAKTMPAIASLLNDNDPAIRRMAARCRDAIAPSSVSTAAKVEERPTIEINLQGCFTSAVIAQYQLIAGQPLEMDSNIRQRVLRLQTAAPVTKTEALAMIERVLREDGHVVITTNAAGKLYATSTDPVSERRPQKPSAPNISKKRP
jgi:hypothetical protein